MSSGLWNVSLRAAEGGRGTWKAPMAPMALVARMAGLLAAVLLAACNNSPYPAGAAEDNTLYLSFDERSPVIWIRPPRTRRRSPSTPTRSPSRSTGTTT